MPAQSFYIVQTLFRRYPLPFHRLLPMGYYGRTLPHFPYTPADTTRFRQAQVGIPNTADN